jgi:tetratricopeptide (TPR) repeat protein
MAVLRTNISPPRAAPAASGDAPSNIGAMMAYAGIFALAVGVNYFTRSMSTRQVTAGPASASDAEKLFSEALQYIKLNEKGQQPSEENYKVAIRTLTSALGNTSSPSELHSKILVQRGLALLMINEEKDAIKDFSSFLKHYPSSEARVGVLINRAQCYEEIGEMDKALADLKKAELDASDDRLRPMIFFNRGCLYQDQCACEAAITDFKRALECNPTNKMKVEILQRLGFCLSEEDLYDDAIHYLSLALKCSDIDKPTLAEILYLRATVYSKIDALSAALKDLESALTNQPSKNTKKDILNLIREIHNSNPDKLA